ncbi:MAG: YihY/virulence factor BrkB family protein [Planctomycetota bacterium]|nr:MAG: YihY/virulence factor BrkB family protein [Planctomycetota bacterium]
MTDPSDSQPAPSAASDAASPARLEKSWWNLLKQTAISWSKDGCSRMGASLAYYTVLSAAPLLVFAVMIVGAIYGQAAAEGQIEEELKGVMGPEAAGGVQAMVAALARAEESTTATILSLGALLFGASAVFNELRYSLNTIWKVRPKPSAHWLYTVRVRLLAFVLVLFVGMLFMGLLILNSALAIAWQWIAVDVPLSGSLFGWLNYGITTLVETLLFAIVFKLLPDGHIAWRDVWLGALVTSLLFGAGSSLIGLYFGHSTTASAYAAAGSLAIFLLWAYYSAQIVYLGAEFTQVYARMYGSYIEPASYAERVERTT